MSCDIVWVKEQLAKAKGKFKKVAEETGVGYSWLTKFHQGGIPKPGYYKIEYLQKYFEAINAEPAHGQHNDQNHVKD